MRLWIATILVVATPTAGRAQAEAAHAPTIRVTTSLVQVDVLAQNKRTRLPLSEMKEEDFRVYGDDKEIPIATFYSGQRYSVRPVALWFAVICNQKNWDEYGSGFIRGKTNLLKPALAYLDKADTVGVAHWCDDQTHGIDLEPGRDTDGALAKIEELMRKPPGPAGYATRRIGAPGHAARNPGEHASSENRAAAGDRCTGITVECIVKKSIAFCGTYSRHR